MVLELKFDSISELAELQRLAVQADKPVYIANEDDSIRVDARSFLGLFALDYSKPLKVITDSLYAMRMLEIQQRNRADGIKRGGGGAPFRSFLLFTGVHEFPIIRNVVSQVVLL